ncbi:TSC22 domain family protein 4 isoform 2-T3 [Polymixia lowei]
MSGGKKRSGFQITSVTSDYSETLTSQSASSPQGSSSQPTTPSLLRKFNSQDASVQGAGSSRFRVVRLAGGRGEPYRRGRWMCTDFLEREEGAGFKRVLDSMRHAHSLESLEMIGLDRERGGAGVHMRALRGAGHYVHSQGTSYLLAQPIGGEGQEFGGIKPLLLHSGPPSPTHQEPINIRRLDSKEPKRALYLDSTPPPPSPRPRNIPPPLRLDVDAAGRSILRVSHSQPSSPGGPHSGDGTFQPTPSAFNLDSSMFHLPGDDRRQTTDHEYS